MTSERPHRCSNSLAPTCSISAEPRRPSSPRTSRSPASRETAIGCRWWSNDLMHLPSLALHRCTITAVSGVGVFTTGGTVTVERSTIAHNMAGGISLSASTLHVRNVFVTDNGHVGPFGGMLRREVVRLDRVRDDRQQPRHQRRQFARPDLRDAVNVAVDSALTSGKLQLSVERFRLFLHVLERVSRLELAAVGHRQRAHAGHVRGF